MTSLRAAQMRTAVLLIMMLFRMMRSSQPLLPAMVFAESTDLLERDTASSKTAL